MHLSIFDVKHLLVDCVIDVDHHRLQASIKAPDEDQLQKKKLSQETFPKCAPKLSGSDLSRNTALSNQISLQLLNLAERNRRETFPSNRTGCFVRLGQPCALGADGEPEISPHPLRVSIPCSAALPPRSSWPASFALYTGCPASIQGAPAAKNGEHNTTGAPVTRDAWPSASPALRARRPCEAGPASSNPSAQRRRPGKQISRGPPASPPESHLTSQHHRLTSAHPGASRAPGRCVDRPLQTSALVSTS